MTNHRDFRTVVGTRSSDKKNFVLKVLESAKIISSPNLIVGPEFLLDMLVPGSRLAGVASESSLLSCNGSDTRFKLF